MVAAGLGAVVFAGSMKTLTISLDASRLVTATLTEADLRHVVGQVLNDQPACIANFDPKANAVPTSITETTALGLYGPQKDWGRGEVVRLAKGASSIRRGEQFKGDLEIVKMELTGGGTGETAKPTPANPSSDKERTFTVFYKKLNVGPAYNTVGGEECTASNTAGCFFHKCTLTYILNSAGNAVETCTVGDCVSYGQSSQAGGSPAHCYHFPDNTTDKVIIGCGDTKDTGGSRTLAIGYNAGGSSVGTTGGGVGNHIIGYEAGTSITKGNYNTFLGWSAGRKTTEGHGNVFIGGSAGYSNKKAGSNVFIGGSAGYDNSTGATTAFEGGYNVFIGSVAGRFNTKGRDNTFLGNRAGYKNTEGSFNAFVGSYTGDDNTKGSQNTFLGYGAGGGNTEGNKNALIGSYAGWKNTKGDENTFLGYEAGASNTEGDGNVFVGYSAGSPSAKGDKNVFIGYQAGKDTLIETGGNKNFFFGDDAGKNTKVTSAGNTFLGQSAGKSATVSGAGNTFLGQNAGQDKTITETGNTYIAGKKVFIVGENLRCDKNQYLRGFKRDGTKDCYDLPKHQATCGVGQIITGYRSNGTPKCTNLKTAILKQIGACGTNKYLKGFNRSANKECRNLPSPPPSDPPVPAPLPIPTPPPALTTENKTWQSTRDFRTCNTYNANKGFCALWVIAPQIRDCRCEALVVSSTNKPCLGEVVCGAWRSNGPQRFQGRN